MQVLNTYNIDPKKLRYKHPNKLVYKRVTKLFDLLDEIILNNSIKDLFIISKEYVKLLEKDSFLKSIKNINSNKEEFDKYQQLFYVLIKHKYFSSNDSIDATNDIVVFISLSLYKFINNEKNNFLKVIDEIPKIDVIDDIVEELWNKYNSELVHFIVTYAVFPYLLEPVFDYRRICSHCNKISNVTFIKCFGCRLFYYCSNLCQNRNFNIHQKICPNIYKLIN